MTPGQTTVALARSPNNIWAMCGKARSAPVRGFPGLRKWESSE